MMWHGRLARAHGRDVHATMMSQSKPIYSLRALGKDDLPERVVVASVDWHRERTIKHDFFAATGFYLNERGERAVLKVGRTARWMGLPFKWIGQRLCQREMRFYAALADVPNVPKLLGEVGETGFLHAYVEGRPLEKGKFCPDHFFDRLFELMHELHRRNIAYVDTNKPQNILLGDDGLPHLIDFQISWDLHTIGNNFAGRMILHRLQREDLYHILKHKRRIRPDELTEEEKIQAAKKSLAIRIHRVVTKPYFIVRRWLFAKLRAKGKILPEGSK